MSDRADERALLIYDDACALCRTWVEAWRGATEGRVVFASSEEIAGRFPDISRKKYQRALQLIDDDGRRYEGAQAVFRVMAHAPGRGWLRRLYEAPLVAPIAEAAYRSVSRHRGIALRVTRLLWGRRITAPRYGLTGWIFLRGLALIYLFAFLSWLPQLPGLVGRDGILPAGFPDGLMQGAALLGATAAIAAFAGIFLGPMLVASWLLYAFVVFSAGDFAAYQWDGLLIEAGFLALFLIPFRAHPDDGRVPASPTVIWLYRFLLFRLLFSSGVSKLMYGDRSWRDLTALTRHFETQPLPGPLAWQAHQLPEAVLKAGAFATLAVEIAVPFLFFLPRRPRAVAAAFVAVYQIAIIATGNYAFFNWLALVLCVPLLDDAVFERLLPKLKPKKKPVALRRRNALAAFAAVVVVLGLTQLASSFLPVWRTAAVLAGAAAKLRLLNAYSLFATVSPTREEIIIEGSMNGITWKPYGLRHAPDDVKRAPGLVAPFQPRFDWHLWLAAVTPAEANPWFARTATKLLQGSDPVESLFKENPFPDDPPAYVRATLYRYRFTTPEERARDGAVWRRAMRAEYLPQMTLSTLQGGP